MKHILWLTSWYPHKNNSLFGNFVERQAKAVSAYANISVLYAVQHPENEYFIDILNDDFLCVKVYFPQTQNAVLKMLRYWKAWRMGYKQILKTKGKPQCIHLHIMYLASIFALYLHYFYKIPFVITEHWTGYATNPPKRIPFFQKYIVRKCLKHSASVATYTTHYAKALARLGKYSNLKIIPNVVNTDLFVPPQYFKPKRTIFRLIHVSTCDDTQKNISGIVRSLAALKHKGYHYEMDIIGGGDIEHKPLIELAQSLNIQDIIHFEKTMKHADLIHHLQRAHIFVLFSNYEGLPCVLLEAMSVGLPVVCTDTGGLEDWINKDTGRVIPIGDENALTLALANMMDNYEQFDISTIRNKIIQTCSMEAVGKEIMRLYV
jgi:glycosyltransferase involved in cell wall biosynthesis